MEYSKRESQEYALKCALCVDNIEDADSYFVREYMENATAQGIDVGELLPEMIKLPLEMREQYWRDKKLQEEEETRTERKDREQEYDGNDPDEDGLIGDWWIVPTEVDV